MLSVKRAIHFAVIAAAIAAAAALAHHQHAPAQLTAAKSSGMSTASVPAALSIAGASGDPTAADAAWSLWLPLTSDGQ